MYLNKCPRCGGIAFEHLGNHSHCINCNYSPDIDDYKDWRKLELKKGCKNPFLNLETHVYSTFIPGFNTGGIKHICQMRKSGVWREFDLSKAERASIENNINRVYRGSGG